MLAKLPQLPRIKTTRHPGSKYVTASSSELDEVEVKDAIKVYGKVHVISSGVTPQKPGTASRAWVTFEIIAQ